LIRVFLCPKQNKEHSYISNNLDANLILFPNKNHG